MRATHLYRWVLAMRLAFGVVLAIVAALAVPSLGRADDSDVRIVELHCEGDPELVIIKNQGSDAQDLAGWGLQSDPTDGEFLSLSQAGALGPGESLVIESGPAASLAIVWTNRFVFRDGDPADFVSILDKTGSVVHEVNCGEVAEGQELEPSPAADGAPLRLSEVEIPNGGGPPPSSSTALTPSLTMAMGGSMLAIALAIFGLPRLVRRPALEVPAELPHFIPRTTAMSAARRGPTTGPAVLTAIGLLALLVLLMVGRAFRR